MPTPEQRAETLKTLRWLDRHNDGHQARFTVRVWKLIFRRKEVTP